MSVETEQNDLRNVIDMISGLDNADDSKLYLYGESQDGFVAALTGAEIPDRIAGMCLRSALLTSGFQWSPPL